MKPLAIDDVKPYEKNAKLHPNKQLKLLADIIKEVGWRQPVVVNQQGTIVVGHGRWMTYLKFKDSLKPIWIMDDTGKTIHGEAETKPLTPEQEMAYRLADNKANESAWDMNLVIEDLKLLSEEMLDLTGFSTDLILESTGGEDEAPDLQEGTDTKIGDLFLLGDHRVLCGDATKLEDVERLMDGKKAEMVFSDPPYNVDYAGGMHGDGTQSKRKKILNDKMSSEKFYEFLFAAISNMITFTKGAFYVCMSSSELHNLWRAFTDGGGHWQSYVIWAKDHFTLSRSDYQHQFEPIMYGLSEAQAEKVENEPLPTDQDGEAILYGWTEHEWYGGRKQGNVWNFPRPTSSKEHPTMKPVGLVMKAIVNSSQKGQIILDTFLGSGSTLIAAHKSGRICYGMELSPHYVDVIVARWEKYTGQKAIKL